MGMIDTIIGTLFISLFLGISYYEKDYYYQNEDCFNITLIENLLKKGECLDKTYVINPKVFGSYLFYYVKNSNIEIVDIFLNNGANINEISIKYNYGDLNKLNETPLFIAIYNNDYDTTKYLIEKGANISHIIEYGRIPLIVAAEINSYDIFKLLVDEGADLNYRSWNGINVYSAVKSSRDPRILKYYLEKF